MSNKVFVIWSNPLFHERVSLLLEDTPLTLAGASNDYVDARTMIDELAPDIVIVEATDGEELAGEETISILRSSANVIRLSLAHNELIKYHRERRTVTDIDDLMHLLSDDPHESATKASR